MDIIPVIDVRRGVAVQAIAGNRSQYLPLDTPLAKTCKPEDVARGYSALYPFKTLYVADLDGIEGGKPNLQLQQNIVRAWQGTNVWIDDGRHEAFEKNDRMSLVAGSETFLTAGLCELEDIKKNFNTRTILSLDFRGDAFLGPPFLLEEPQLWPEKIIVMSLDKVGCRAGPDLKKIERVLHHAGVDKKIYAAGSIRNIEDLLALQQRGVAGALIATALHAGQIKIGDLLKIADRI